MSSYEIESMLEMLMGSAGSFIGPVIASILSGVILTYCIRWFIFVKAGEKMSEKFRDCTYPGMTIAASGFYGPQGRVLRMPLAMPDMLDTFESFRFGEEKVTNFEMEGSAIAGIAAHLGHNAGTVCCIIAHRHHKASNPDYKPQVRKLIELCLEKLAE